MTEKNRLNKGLDFLLSTGSVSGKKDGKAQGRENNGKGEEMRNIPVDLIQRGKYQPRIEIDNDSLRELAASIEKQGIMQPIVIRPISADKYEIIAGERRWRACQLAGFHEIPAIIKPVNDESAIAMSLIENIQREDLNPMEEAFALRRLQDEFNLTQREVGDAVGKSRTTVTNLLRLINLSEDVRRMLETKILEMGHARALLSLSPPEQYSVAKVVVSKRLSVRQTEELVRRTSAGKKPALTNQRESSADIRSLENELSEKIGANVLIQHTVKGKGKLVISYNGLDELDGILNHIR
ncbi:ParB/RepB/Spo0J family partition protein [OM182 bacterium]|jgi:ParB family chromosome partitioning protein|nr:ParB/RepB/Spo0J family partition protein [OM182 bacterium]